LQKSREIRAHIVSNSLHVYVAKETFHGAVANVKCKSAFWCKYSTMVVLIAAQTVKQVISDQGYLAGDIIYHSLMRGLPQPGLSKGAILAARPHIHAVMHVIGHSKIRLM
jgi:hypothetical protein